jgi:hypothetical protein
MITLNMPGPKTPGCDFCSVSVPAVKEYLCEDFDMGTFIVEGMPSQTTHSTGSWLACKECAILIDADDRDSLAKRAAELIPINLEFAKKYLKLNEYKEMHDAAVIAIAVSHSGFFAHRIKQ